MHAFLTGSTGFIGRRLATILRERGNTVTVAKRGDDHFRLMQDAKPDVVFHLAAHYVRDHEPVDVARLVQSNVEYGAMILEAMRMHGVRRIVTASSLWTQPVPVNLYAATKLAFNALVDYYTNTYSILATTLLLGDTYGPEDRRGKIIYRMFEAIIRDEALPMTPGEQILDLTHVDDVCLAFLHAATLPCLEHDTWAVHAGERLTLRALAARVEQAAGKPLKAVWGALPYPPAQVMNPMTSPNLPGWAPSHPLLDWLSRLAKEI